MHMSELFRVFGPAVELAVLALPLAIWIRANFFRHEVKIYAILCFVLLILLAKLHIRILDLPAQLDAPESFGVIGNLVFGLVVVVVATTIFAMKLPRKPRNKALKPRMPDGTA